MPDEERFTPEGAADWKAPEVDEPKLKISESLLPKSPEPEQPALRISDSLKKATESEPNPNPIEELTIAESTPEDLSAFLENHSYIQRDSGKTWNFGGFAETGRGKSIQLVNSESAGRVNLNLTDFVEKLKTPGGPWSIA